MKLLFKKPLFYVGLAVIIIIAISIFVSQKEKPAEYNTITIEASALTQEVSVTGTVKPAESVELAFEKLGKVATVNVAVNDKVKKGELLASLVGTDLYAQLAQAQASLESTKALLKNYESALAAQQAKLDELKSGTRPEELTIAQTAVLNATKDLADAKTNLENIKAKTAADLQSQLETTAASLSNSINTGLAALYSLTDIQESYFSDYSQDSYQVATAKEAAVYSLLGKINGGRMTNSGLGSLSGGAKALVIAAENEPTETNINLAIVATRDALIKIRTTLNSIPLSPLTSANITTINTQRGYIDAEISSVATNENAIAVQKASNQTSISTAESSITTAENSLKTAQDNYNLKLAGATNQQIAAQEANVELAEANVKSQLAQIKYAQANVSNIAAQISKNGIRSPLDGTVVMQEAKIGEIIQANIPVIKVMTENNFQIEANIAEVDIANIKLEDVATVTLDAYGSDKTFTASVVEIDPAETIIDGVPTYKVTFQFNEEDGLIKSGMTANIDIVTATRENVINIPQRAVLRQDGKKIVRILINNKTVEEVPVTTGIRGTNGNIEILEGLSEGQTLILSVTE